MDDLPEHHPKPWEQEPDVLEWRDKDTGLRCLILRRPYGQLTGYVRIMRDHPLYKRRKSQRAFDRLVVHGGITFHRTVKHKRYMKRGFWVGFDCAHAFDLVPKLAFTHEWQYRNMDYVREMVTVLAQQLRID